MSHVTLWLGAMNFGGRVPEAASHAIIAHALDRDITHIDTANVYGDGASETIVGQATRNMPKVTIATKVGLMRNAGKPEGLSPSVIRASVDASRRRLGRDCLDTLYLHAPDPETPIETTIDTLVHLIDERKIGSWSVSNYAAWQLAEMLVFCEARKLPRPLLSQVLYNVLVRQIEVEYLAFARARSLATVVYNPLAGGLLSGKHRQSSLPSTESRFAKNKMYQRRYWSKPMFDRVSKLTQIAQGAERTLVSLSYAWLAAREGVAGILIGPSAIEHIDDAVDAIALPLSDETFKKIDEAEAVASGTDARYAR